MLRLSGKAQKIAYAILGTPANMIKHKKYKPKKQLITQHFLP